MSKNEVKDYIEKPARQFASKLGTSSQFARIYVDYFDSHTFDEGGKPRLTREFINRKGYKRITWFMLVNDGFLLVCYIVIFMRPLADIIVRCVFKSTLTSDWILITNLGFGISILIFIGILVVILCLQKEFYEKNKLKVFRSYFDDEGVDNPVKLEPYVEETDKLVKKTNTSI